MGSNGTHFFRRSDSMHKHVLFFAVAFSPWLGGTYLDYIIIPQRLSLYFDSYAIANDA